MHLFRIGVNWQSIGTPHGTVIAKVDIQFASPYMHTVLLYLFSEWPETERGL